MQEPLSRLADSAPAIASLLDHRLHCCGSFSGCGRRWLWPRRARLFVVAAPGRNINRCSRQRPGYALLRQSGRSIGLAATTDGQVRPPGAQAAPRSTDPPVRNRATVVPLLAGHRRARFGAGHRWDPSVQPAAFGSVSQDPQGTAQVLSTPAESLLRSRRG